jgi:hypothetical protein
MNAWLATNANPVSKAEIGSMSSGHVPVLLVVAAFSRHETLLDHGRQRLEMLFGPTVPDFFEYPFNQTRYYEPTMGPGLRKRLFVFRDLVAADSLAAIKRTTIALEGELTETGPFTDARPINLDPGILTLGKFMLATTKDQAHRIYLTAGIWAEVTLRFEAGNFEPWPWTYADYRQADLRAFLTNARSFYRDRLRDIQQEQPPGQSSEICK